MKNFTTQERLLNIAVLNIEKKKSQDINIEKIIIDFAHNKTRKKFVPISIFSYFS